jgi:lysophosphatidate acyltransferase
MWPIVPWLLALLAILLTVILYEEYPSFRYRFKFVLYVIYVSTFTFLTIPLYLWRPKDVRNIEWTAPFVRAASFLLGLSWEVEGLENLDPKTPCVIICNHQSILDILGMAEIWKHVGKCAVVAKREILYVFPFGLGAWLCGTVFIDRSDSTGARNQISTTGEALRANGTKLWIFPEGTRHKGSELLPFKKGAFHIAAQFELPIIPVVISPYNFINDDEKVFESGRMMISILPPIPTKGLETQDVSKLADSTRLAMGAEYMRMSRVLLGKEKES